MSRSIAKKLDAQLKKVLRDNNKYYTCCMDTEDIQKWYVLVKNLPEPYEGGEYIFKLSIPEDFPDSPPSLAALTPNGLFELGGKCCVSIGEFHSNDHHKTNKKGDYGWKPSFGISGFVLQGAVNALLSFTDEERGVRLNNQSDEVKKRLASESREYNIDNNKIPMELLQIHQECFPNLEVWS